MRTSKCAGLVGGCIGLLLFGLLMMEWLVLLFIIPLFLLLFIGVLVFHSRELQIDASRSLSNVKIFEDDKVEVTLQLRNKGRTLQFLELFDTLPNRVSIENGSNYAVLPLRKNEAITITYEISCPVRGHYQVGPLCLRVRDYLGMFYKETAIDTVSELTVIPQIEEIGDIAVQAKANIYPGIMQAKRTGIGTEFFGLRNYTTSDTFKRINWKSFARWSHLMVNEYELESTTDIIIMLDARETQDTGTLKHNPIEYGIKAAVAISSRFLKRRDRVGLIIYGESEGKLKWVYPESGKKQLYKTIKELVEVQTDGDFPFNAAIDTAVTHMLPKKSLIVLISSLEDDPSIPEAIKQLLARSFQVIVVSPSPIDIEYSLQPNDPHYDLAHKILSFERKNFLSQLRNSGARVVDWNPTLPLAVSLKEVERYQIRR
jgi:uncharacterized protein (DUF58 family)